MDYSKAIPKVFSRDCAFFQPCYKDCPKDYSMAIPEVFSRDCSAPQTHSKDCFKATPKVFSRDCAAPRPFSKDCAASQLCYKDYSSVGPIFRYSNMFEYIWTNILICQNIR